MALDLECDRHRVAFVVGFVGAGLAFLLTFYKGTAGKDLVPAGLTAPQLIMVIRQGTELIRIWSALGALFVILHF